MFGVKFEFVLLIFFAFGWCMIYNRVFQICYALTTKLREDPRLFKSNLKRSYANGSDYADYSDSDLGLGSDEEYSDETSNYLHKTANIAGLHYSVEAAKKHPTHPKTYTVNGTGTSARVAYRFKPEVFNSFCKDSPNLVAIVPVYSRPDAFLKRTSLRSTLGHACKLYRCKIFFIIGMSQDETVNKKLQLEYEAEKDILAMAKLDTYRDLNNKAFVMLNWIINHCHQPRYVIRLIDDVHLNLHLLFPQLNAIKTKRYLFGFISSGRKALRTKKSKWYISEKEWPFVDYPDYVTGTMFAFRTGLSVELRRNVLRAPYCWIEDVWFAGTVRLQSGIPLLETSVPPFTGKPGSLNPENVNEYLYVHDLKANDMYTLYIASKMNRENNNTAVAIS